MNLEKLDEAIAYIEAHPTEHDQATWLDAKCGTTACLAGHVSLLNGGRPVDGMTGMVWVGKSKMHVADHGRQVLDLDQEQYVDLFYADDLAEVKRLREQYAREGQHG